MKSVEIFIPKLNQSIIFWIGKNAEDNFQIIDDASQSDMWFHVSNESSCHVIARISDIEIHRKNLLSVVKQGAILCKQHSKLKSIKNVEIVYTKIENVEKTEVFGKVQIKNSKNIVI